MTTIKDVAAKAGVSVGTVSNFVTGAHYVHPDTARLIKAAIEELGYKPNSYAKNLRTRNNQEIGVILPNVYDQYYSFLLAGIEKELRERNYYVNLGLTDDFPETELALLSNMMKKNLCGLIIVSCQNNADSFEKLSDTPMVFIDRKVGNGETNFLSFNYYETIQFLLSRLEESDFHRVGLIAGPEEFTSEAECAKAYQNFYASQGIQVEEGLLQHIRTTKEEAFRIGMAFLQNEHPQAVISTSQVITNGLEQAASIIGISLTKDVLLISLGQENWNDHVSYNGIINTMRPAHFLGKKAASLLLANINSPMLFEKQQIYMKDKIAGKELYDNSSFGKKKKSISEPLKLLMLESPNTHTIIQARFDFTRKTGINIDVTVCKHAELLNRLLDPESQRYDIFMYDNPWLDILVKQNCLSDITSFVQSDEIDNSSFLQGLPEKVGQSGGRYYGLPFLLGPQLLLYRRELFEDKLLQEQYEKKYRSKLMIPKSWFEFNIVSSFFTAALNENSPVQYGTAIPALNQAVLLPELMPRIWAYGGSVFDQHGNPAVESPTFIKGIGSFIETFAYVDSQYMQCDVEKGVEDFFNGKIAMLVSFASFISDVQHALRSNKIGEIGYTNIPGGHSVLGSWGLGISRECKRHKDACEFIRWTCDPDMSNYFTILNGQSPLRNVYTNDELVTHYPWLPIVERAYPGSKRRKSVIKPDGSLIDITDVEGLIYKHIIEILQQQRSIEDAMHELRLDLESLSTK